MNQRFKTILLLRRVFTLARQGAGLAASLVETFRDSGGREGDVARKILLGYPVPVALKEFAEGSSKELSMLAGLLANSPAASAQLIGRKGERLSIVLERWMKLNEARVMERRVMEMRSHMMSAVLGAVVAMLATLGPLVAGLNFFAPTTQLNGTALLLSSAAMVVVSTLSLGLFMSGRRFYVDILIAMAAFGLAVAVVSPLANVPTVNLWGIK